MESQIKQLIYPAKSKLLKVKQKRKRSVYSNRRWNLQHIFRYCVFLNKYETKLNDKNPQIKHNLYKKLVIFLGNTKRPHIVSGFHNAKAKEYQSIKDLYISLMNENNFYQKSQEFLKKSQQLNILQLKLVSTHPNNMSKVINKYKYQLDKILQEKFKKADAKQVENHKISLQQRQTSSNHNKNIIQDQNNQLYQQQQLGYDQSQSYISKIVQEQNKSQQDLVKKSQMLNQIQKIEDQHRIFNKLQNQQQEVGQRDQNLHILDKQPQQKNVSKNWTDYEQIKVLVFIKKNKLEFQQSGSKFKVGINKRLSNYLNTDRTQSDCYCKIRQFRKKFSSDFEAIIRFLQYKLGIYQNPLILKYMQKLQKEWQKQEFENNVRQEKKIESQEYKQKKNIKLLKQVKNLVNQLKVKIKRLKLNQQQTRKLIKQINDTIAEQNQQKQ